MNQIKHNQLEEFLKSFPNQNLPQLYLVWGEKYLTDKKADLIVSKLISKEHLDMMKTDFKIENINWKNIVITSLAKDIKTEEISLLDDIQTFTFISGMIGELESLNNKYNDKNITNIKNVISKVSKKFNILFKFHDEKTEDYTDEFKNIITIKNLFDVTKVIEIEERKLSEAINNGTAGAETPFEGTNT